MLPNKVVVVIVSMNYIQWWPQQSSKFSCSAVYMSVCVSWSSIFLYHFSSVFTVWSSAIVFSPSADHSTVKFLLLGSFGSLIFSYYCEFWVFFIFVLLFNLDASMTLGSTPFHNFCIVPNTLRHSCKLSTVIALMTLSIGTIFFNSTFFGPTFLVEPFLVATSDFDFKIRFVNHYFGAFGLFNCQMNLIFAAC